MRLINVIASVNLPFSQLFHVFFVILEQRANSLKVYATESVLLRIFFCKMAIKVPKLMLLENEI